jgi:phospho-N-acetylmuramoyl-pentapeptide-transferase
MIAAVLVFLAALLSAVALYPVTIRVLTRARMGQLIREEGPSSHHGKAGTPTAGGLLFVPIAAVLYLLADRHTAGGLVLLGLLAGGALGLSDDLRKILARRNLGLRAREKFVIQLVTGAAIGYVAWRWGFDRQLVPFDGAPRLGAWLIPIGALAVTAASNAFNLTDGSDGLAAGTGAVAFAAIAVSALLQNHAAYATMPAVLCGILAGFLVFNFYPARIFMGDTGSLALGTAMAGAALVTGLLWYLPVLALVFVVETLSVIAQVASFKMTGRRIFRMSPLHHHFHELGWPEPKVAAWSYAVGALAAALVLIVAGRGAGP